MQSAQGSQIYRNSASGNPFQPLSHDDRVRYSNCEQEKTIADIFVVSFTKFRSTWNISASGWRPYHHLDVFNEVTANLHEQNMEAASNSIHIASMKRKYAQRLADMSLAMKNTRTAGTRIRMLWMHSSTRYVKDNIATSRSVFIIYAIVLK